MNNDFRKQPPAPLAPLPVNIPAAQVTDLDSGLRIVTVRDDRQPLVSFRLVFESGDIHDPEGRVGVAAAMCSLLNEGTLKYTSRELAEEIDRLGANLSASSASDHMVVRASALSMFSGEILDLLGELVLRSTFPENEIELYRQNTIEGLKYQRSQPDFLADEQVARVIFGEHPYSISSPSPDDVRSLKRDDLTSFHKSHFVPNNAILIAVGDLDPDAFAAEIERRFSGWQAVSVDGREFPAPPRREGRTLTIVDRPGSSQANIVLSNLALKRNDPDYFRVLVMNQVLGAGASSRLFMNLREEKGYTYGAYSRIYSKRFAGSFEATAEVRTSVTGDSLKEFFYELERIREERVPENELKDARNFLSGVFPIRIETQGGLISQIVSQRLYGLPDDYLETYRDNVLNVSAEDVQEAARKYVHPEHIAVVIVGDAAEVIPLAAPFAEETEVFDFQGNPVDPAAYDADQAASGADAA